MTSPCVLSALALASLPLPTFCNHVHKVSCHERARACIVTQLSCKNPARLTHLQRRDFAMHRAQLINTNISRISPESTPIQEGIDKEAGGAAKLCQACAAGTPVHQAELGPLAGTHFSVGCSTGEPAVAPAGTCIILDGLQATMRLDRNNLRSPSTTAEAASAAPCGSWREVVIER